MEKPLPPKQFKRTVKQKAILGIIGLVLLAAGAFIRELFVKSNPSTVIKTENNNKDSASSNTTTNKDVVISNDQNNAGRDIKNDNRKIEVKGTAFFDSAKQINQYGIIKQRHIDLGLMKKMIDSIPNKRVKIEIGCGGDGEGENLGKEMSEYFIKMGYSKPVLIPSFMTGNYEIIEYLFDKADSTFKITIHPQRNDKQLY